MHKLVYILGKLYTLLLRKKFHHFGRKSVIKPILNSSNEKMISIGENVNIGAFNRITAITEFGGRQCKSSNEVKIEINNDVDIGNNSFITANNLVKIGRGVIMSSYVFITDHDHGFDNPGENLRDQPLTEGGFVRIGENVFLGVKSSVLKNVEIGAGAIVAANAVVTRDVPPLTIVAGNPAKIIKQYDVEKKAWIKV